MHIIYLSIYLNIFYKETLQEARSKLKIAEIKSDLSTEEDDNRYKRKKFKNKLPVPDPPTYSSTKYIEGNKFNNLIITYLEIMLTHSFFNLL